MILALSYLPQDKYETLLTEVNTRRIVVNATIKAILPREGDEFRAYAIHKIIKGEYDNER